MSETPPSKKTTWEKLNEEAKEIASVEASANTTTKKTSTDEPASEIEPPKKLTPPSIEMLEEQLLNAETQLEHYKSEVLRYKEQDRYHLAEMENVRRRARLDIENSRKFSLESFIKDLLPVKDYLENGLKAAIDSQAPKSTLEGLRLTLKELHDVLKKNNVKIINPIDEPFDPHFHEALSLEEQAGVPPNTIIEVLKKGCLLHDRLICPALVKLAKKPSEKNISG